MSQFLSPRKALRVVRSTPAQAGLNLCDEAGRPSCSLDRCENALDHRSVSSSLRPPSSGSVRSLAATCVLTRNRPSHAGDDGPS